jgi:hypothetical protein
VSTLKHRTYHSSEAHDGKVAVACETCMWRRLVPVDGLSYVEAMTAIYKARDTHEADPFYEDDLENPAVDLA